MLAEVSVVGWVAPLEVSLPLDAGTLATVVEDTTPVGELALEGSTGGNSSLGGVGVAGFDVAVDGVLVGELVLVGVFVPLDTVCPEAAVPPTSYTTGLTVVVPVCPAAVEALVVAALPLEV